MCNDIVANRGVPSPTRYDWTEDADGSSSVMTTVDHSLEVFLQFVKCACTEKTKCITLICEYKNAIT